MTRQGALASPRPGAQDLMEARAALCEWWSKARELRDALPWRGTRDPWAVLVSETMLIQTQADRVAARFPEMLERFPTPLALASSSPGDVLRAWSGLGYNRRGAALHGAACGIVERHGGVVPADLGDLIALPGVGPYVARAVLAFAFGVAVGTVDTNVSRVLARAFAGRPIAPTEAQRLADEFVALGSARDTNLALMDLGSTICTARAPRCANCPLVARCAWRSAAAAATDPAAAPARARSAARFTGSDREGRGRLVRAACAGPIPSDAVASAAGWPDDPARARRVASGLVDEGLLLLLLDGALALP